MEKLQYLNIDETLITKFGNKTEGVFLVESTMPTSSSIDNVISSFTEKYGHSLCYKSSLLSFDAVNLLLKTIKDIAVQAGDGSILVGRHKLRETLYSTANFDGFTGNLSCDAYGDCSTGNIYVIGLMALREK